MVSNDTAVFLWKAFQNPATIEAVIARGLEEYEVDEDTLRVAVCRFVEEALKYKIIEAIE